MRMCASIWLIIAVLKGALILATRVEDRQLESGWPDMANPLRIPRAVTRSVVILPLLRWNLVSGAKAFALVWLISAPTTAEAQLTSARPGESPHFVPRIEGEITLDGRADEPFWKAIDPLPVFTHIPTFGAPPTERTEFRIAYDAEYLYFSCQAYDSDPTGIRMFSLERDETSYRSDFCAIYIDSLNDEENALQFKTSPSGNRSDSQRTNDGQRSDNSWDAFWDAAVFRDEHGWYAELRIPFSSFLFQAIDGRVIMGVSMLRNISRKNERHIHPAISPESSNTAHTQPSRMRKIVLEGMGEQRKPGYLTPYTLAGGGYSHGLDSLGTRYDRANDRVGEAGLDFRYGLTSNLTLHITANTDFAQVEADDQQVNLSRFSLFFPEKRRFFQERASNFEYSLGGQDRLFHSRTVGLAGGRPVRILGGGRMVGRVGEWDVGILDLQTAESELLPSENMGAARLRRRVLNPNSYVGGILTSRLGSGGEKNIVYGADAIFRLVGDEYLVLNWAQSFDDQEQSFAPGKLIRPLERGLVRLNWERRGVDGLTYALDLARVGDTFNPGMGFLRRRDYARGQANLGYGWRPGPEARLFTYALQMEGAVFRRNSDGTIETVEIGSTAVLQTWSQQRLTLSVPFRYENLESSFSLPEGTSVPAGTYSFAAALLRYSGPPGDRVRTTAAVEVGHFFDGRQVAVSVGPIWDPSVHLNLAANYRLDRVIFPDRNEDFTAHLIQLRAQVMLSTETSAIGFVQYSKTDNSIIANLRFRFNPREGNDFYIVWNEGLVTSRNSFDPVRPMSDERTILIKYSHTLQFGI